MTDQPKHDEWQCACVARVGEYTGDPHVTLAMKRNPAELDRCPKCGQTRPTRPTS